MELFNRVTQTDHSLRQKNRSLGPLQTSKNVGKSNSESDNGNFYRVENDAQLLANRIALLKQEEMRTWKKIEETKKRSDLVHK